MRPALTIRASFADTRRENQSQHPKAKMIRACSSSTRKRVEAMRITEVITTPRSPRQNAYVERVIGSIRRECLDHMVVFNDRHLRRLLSLYFDHHRTLTHLSLDKDCP
jgi:transposase InsO family protein